MPEKQHQFEDWTPERLIRWARKIGPHTAELIEKVMAARMHPQQGFRSYLGILRLRKSYGEYRLENDSNVFKNTGNLRYHLSCPVPDPACFRI